MDQNFKLAKGDARATLPLVIASIGNYEKIKDDALHLPLEDRSRLASSLLESLDDDEEISGEWMEEINRRAKNLRDGISGLTPHDQVMAEVRDGLAQIRSSRQSIASALL